MRLSVSRAAMGARARAAALLALASVALLLPAAIDAQAAAGNTVVSRRRSSCHC
jgi:hypothetical protein